jgi:hypothetical protein
MGVRILSYTIACHALLSFRRDPVQIQHVEDIFCLDIEKFWYTVPVKRIKQIMMLTGIFFEKYINKKSNK